jgi:acetyltransferase-like isoleucine patch superfamily enzyme
MVMEKMDVSLLRSCGLDTTIYPWCKIVKPERVAIGCSCILNDFVFINGYLTTGDFVHIASYASLEGEVRLGDFVGISAGVRIYGRNEQYRGGCLTNPTVPQQFRKVDVAPVTIGNHCLIGANSIVLPGSVINDGAVVGALSLVKETIPSWEIWGGCPARKIGVRDFKTILQMEQAVRLLCYRDGQYIPKSHWELHAAKIRNMAQEAVERAATMGELRP